MQKLVIIFALVACSVAAPVEKDSELSKPVALSRPSPINPDIPSDPKPEEKITLISDADVKPPVLPEPAKLPIPYVLPKDPLLRAKREDKDSSESDESSSEEEKKSSRPLAGTPASIPRKNSIKKPTPPVPSPTNSADGTTLGAGFSSTPITPTHPRKPYSPHIHQHNEHLFKPTTDSHLTALSSSTSTSTTTTVAPNQDHVNDKRDIPVPLTPKYHHDDDNASKHKEEPSSPAKVPKEEVKQEELKNEGHKPELVAAAAATLPQVAVARPIPVAELLAKKPSTE